MASGDPEAGRTSRPVATLLPALTALRPRGRLDEEEMMARIIVGLPITVLQHQHLHPAQPAGEILTTLHAALRPQPGSLQHRPVANAAHRADLAPPDRTRSNVCQAAALINISAWAWAGVL
jgi:hypothetical protein